MMADIARVVVSKLWRSCFPMSSHSNFHGQNLLLRLLIGTQDDFCTCDLWLNYETKSEEVVSVYTS